MAPTVHKPASLGDFINTVSNFRTASEGRQNVWLRGINDSSHKLIPSLYRRKDLKAEQIKSLESSIIGRFKDRAIPYIKSPAFNEWGWLFFMQHYGVPTRLLDWTENPFIALFFALKYAKRNSRKSFSSEAIVWMVDPDEWNNETLKNQGYQGGILNTDAHQLNPFKPDSTFPDNPQYCLAIYGAHNSSRIVAQRGSFFIFGAPGYPMEETYRTHVNTDCLHKIVIEKDNIEKILKELLNSGITESVVFPDLEGLAKEIKREFGFEG